MKLGYIRVSTVEQNEERQTRALLEKGVEKENLFIDKQSGKNAERAQLKALLAFCRKGDVVITESISRIARNTKDLLTIIEQLTNKGVDFISLKESIDTSTPQGKFMLTVFGAMAELERESILERQREGIAIAKEQGFLCGHLALSKVITEYPVDDGALTPGYAMYLKKIFAKNDLDIAVLGCYLNLANPDEGQLAKITHRYLAHIRFASLLGVGVVGTETGAVNEAYKFEEKNHSDEALDIFIQNVKPVISYAEKMGVIFAIEPVWKHIVCNPKRARKVLDEIASPNLQIIFDPVNLLDISNYQNRDAIIEEAIELLGDDIAMVHMKDFVVQDGKLVSVAAGTGEMNYEKIIRFIKERKPYIHVTLENTTPENAVQSKEYIQGLYDSCRI